MTTNFFSPLSFVAVRDPGSGMGKNQDPGSGINIPDPQHCLTAAFCLSFKQAKFEGDALDQICIQ
jgi:hypothetical protein